MSQDVTDLAKTKSLEELAREQRVSPVKMLEDVLGKGADLWESDEELDQFLADIANRRHDTAHP